MPGPLKASEIAEKKAGHIPEAVFEAFNALITKNWDGRQAIVRQKELLTKITEATTLDSEEIFGNHYLDVEDAYEKAGWVVEYDKPGFNESYEAFFTFSKKKKSKKR